MEELNMAFIPKDKRQSQPMTNSDSIVVVGQTRQKRKRKAKAESNNDAQSDSKKTKACEFGDGDNIVDFDYASTQNLLDGPGPSTRNDSRSEPKSKKGKGISLFFNDCSLSMTCIGSNVHYGNFPAPPRAYNEVKGGNKSLTFR